MNVTEKADKLKKKGKGQTKMSVLVLMDNVSNKNKHRSNKRGSSIRREKQ